MLDFPGPPWFSEHSPCCAFFSPAPHHAHILKAYETTKIATTKVLKTQNKQNFQSNFLIQIYKELEANIFYFILSLEMILDFQF